MHQYKHRLHFIVGFVTLLLILGAILVLRAILTNEQGVRDKDQPGLLLDIRTDTTPLELELNDKSISLNSSRKTVPVTKGVLYTYRARANVDGAPMVLVGSITPEKDSAISFDFKQYSESVILDTICNNTDYVGGCPFTVNNSSHSFVEGNTWCVVVSKPANVEPAITILKRAANGWEIAGGPGSDVGSAGYFPPGVDEVLRNEI